jgi:hypothetical protein
MAENIKAPGADVGGGSIADIANDNEIDLRSPNSDTSGETLREDGSSDIRSDGTSGNTFSSPVSPESLNFSSLTIHPSSQSPKGGVGKYTPPYQRGIRNYDGHRFAPLGGFGRGQGGFRNGSPAYGGRGGNSHQNSRTWLSSEAQAMQEFMVIRNSMRRQFRNSDVAKWKHSDYIAHREAMITSAANRLNSKLKGQEEAIYMPPISQETQQSLAKWGILGNFDMEGNLGRVLGEQTIWCDDWLNGKDEVAPWPSLAEMKWEGDDRAKTGVGRFLPLPREEGPPGLSWNQLPCVEQYPMDQVARVPTLEDVLLPIDDQIEEDHEYLWSMDLEKAIDDFLDS